MRFEKATLSPQKWRTSGAWLFKSGSDNQRKSLIRSQENNGIQP
jgi:hypothetical protein